MEPIHRLSMNTSLKNARIFDDDAWDDEDCPKIKKEIEEESADYATGSAHTSNNCIKEEPEDEHDDTFEEECDDTSNTSAVDTSEEGDTSSNEEGELKDSLYDDHDHNGAEPSEKLPEELKVKSQTPPPPRIKPEELKVKCQTPPPPRIKPDPDAPSIDSMFDESPYNKELFNSLKIKEETPIKTENEDIVSRNSLKSAKRTVFNRHSPYKKVEKYDNLERRISAKSRLGPIRDSDEEADDDLPRAKRYRRDNVETDPVVITRREKQIEYGKNTIGYENYIKMVPRSERAQEDPKTPPKFGKYSRRGWEGLIKQWRIKLHKYDPPDDTA